MTGVWDWNLVQAVACKTKGPSATLFVRFKSSPKWLKYRSPPQAVWNFTTSWSYITISMATKAHKHAVSLLAGYIAVVLVPHHPSHWALSMLFFSFLFILLLLFFFPVKIKKIKCWIKWVETEAPQALGNVVIVTKDGFVFIYPNLILLTEKHLLLPSPCCHCCRAPRNIQRKGSWEDEFSGFLLGPVSAFSSACLISFQQ